MATHAREAAKPIEPLAIPGVPIVGPAEALWSPIAAAGSLGRAAGQKRPSGEASASQCVSVSLASGE
jgi:hypothetical protein